MHAVLHDGAGLGNRLKCIASTLRVMWPGDTLHIHWQRGRIPDRFSDLFSLKDVDYDEDDSMHWFPDNIDTWRLTVPKGVADIDCQYANIPQEMLEIYRNIFAQFIPNAKSRQLADSLGVFDNAIHVRDNATTTIPAKDMPVCWHDTNDIIQPIEKFTRIIDNAPGKVFLSCHNATVQQKIIAGIADLAKIVTLPNKDFVSMVHAVADLMMLGGAKNLFAYAGSSFSEVAWWLGGCKSKVTVIHWDRP